MSAPLVLSAECIEAADLRAAYLRVLKGESVRRVRYKNGEDERETDFGPSNVAELRLAMKDAEARCVAAGRRRRFAIGVGVYPRNPFGREW